MTLYDHLPVNTRKANFKDIFFETDDRVFIKHSVDFLRNEGNVMQGLILAFAPMMVMLH